MTVGTLNRIRRWPRRFRHSLHSRVLGCFENTPTLADTIDMEMHTDVPASRGEDYNIEFYIYVNNRLVDSITSSAAITPGDSISVTCTALAADLDTSSHVSAIAAGNIITVSGTGLTNVRSMLRYGNRGGTETY